MLFFEVPLNECSKAVKFLVVSVHANHLRKGIAETAMRLSCEQGKKFGCTHAIAEATAFRVSSCRFCCCTKYE